jgi:hypothetical protein
VNNTTATTTAAEALATTAATSYYKVLDLSSFSGFGHNKIRSSD